MKDFWRDIRARIERRAVKARPAGQVRDGRPVVTPIGAGQQGHDANAVFEDQTGVPLWGIDLYWGNFSWPD